jgi:hypothetical protein
MSAEQSLRDQKITRFSSCDGDESFPGAFNLTQGTKHIDVIVWSVEKRRNNYQGYTFGWLLAENRENMQKGVQRMLKRVQKERYQYERGNIVAIIKYPGLLRAENCAALLGIGCCEDLCAILGGASAAVLL